MRAPVSVDGMGEYQFVSKIGEGSFSKVFKVQHKKTKKTYAVKVIRDRYRSLEQVQRCDEIQVMLQIGRHPNIIGLHEVVFEPVNTRLSLVLDLMDMNLLDLMENKKITIDVPIALKLTCQILRGLAHIHAKGLIHRDIKPENCLVNPKTMELRIADFGSTRSATNNTNMTEYIATRWYRPPEVLLTSGEYGAPLDIWAVGCVLYELITRRPLFPGKTAIDQLQKIHEVLGTPDNSVLLRFHIANNMRNRMCFTEYKGSGLRQLLPNVDECVIDLLMKLLTYIPEDRITAQEALSHPAFAEIPVMERLPVLPDTPKSAPVTTPTSGKDKVRNIGIESQFEKRFGVVKLPKITYGKNAKVNQPKVNMPVRTAYGPRRGIIKSKPGGRSALGAQVHLMPLRAV